MQVATVCKEFVCEMYYVSIKSTECQCVMLYSPYMGKWSPGTVLRRWKRPWSKNMPNPSASAATDAKPRRNCLSWLTPSPGTVWANIATQPRPAPWHTVAAPDNPIAGVPRVAPATWTRPTGWKSVGTTTRLPDPCRTSSGAAWYRDFKNFWDSHNGRSNAAANFRILYVL